MFENFLIKKSFSTRSAKNLLRSSLLIFLMSNRWENRWRFQTNKKDGKTRRDVWILDEIQNTFARKSGLRYWNLGGCEWFNRSENVTNADFLISIIDLISQRLATQSQKASAYLFYYSSRPFKTSISPNLIVQWISNSIQEASRVTKWRIE